MEIWTGVTDVSLTDSQLKDSATQLLTKYKSGALVTQSVPDEARFRAARAAKNYPQPKLNFRS